MVKVYRSVSLFLWNFASLRKPTSYIGVPPKGERKYRRDVGFQKGAIA
jgi:hypothetical protein